MTILDVLTALENYYRSRWALALDERHKAMDRGDKVAELGYQLVLDESAAIFGFLGELKKECQKKGG